MEVFAALADPIRREVVELLARGPLDAGTIAAHFSVSRPAVSRHLRVLRESGIVAAKREAQRQVYSLDPAGLMELDRWITRYRGFWNERLNALTTSLEEDT